MPQMAAPEVDGVDARRCRMLNEAPLRESGAVVYWMSRDQRCEDNWALVYARLLAVRRRAPVHVVFCLVPRFLDATIRQFDFMLKGLREVEAGLRDSGIPFHLHLGKAADHVPPLCERLGATAVVCDMSPLRVPAQWASEVASACGDKGISLIQVDAHNVVPVWAASDKQEYAARTIRKKIMLPLQVYLSEFPVLEKHAQAPAEWPKAVDWGAAESSLEVDRTVQPVAGITPGSKAGRAKLEEFVAERLKRFDASRNDPNVDALSGLSPYLHFGQLAPQRCALRVREAAAADAALEKAAEGFIEEAVVRRELADNFCFYNERYDALEGAPSWAQQTLIDHEGDKREHTYSLEESSRAPAPTTTSGDQFRNAAQLQMVREGKMHGFLRMYWAKKIDSGVDSQSPGCAGDCDQAQQEEPTATQNMLS
ncbi:unnamed protein product [Prorocentrum cordatum]|uniref:Photolyase/cryptochrome alpha/beta domain-containing protein n=1 Tax=Prorocentrum cordatum TaxID=2364126 RepID=A0ABN9UJ33_9DINO|nr:unnamed protein product [Polarella glacialis]